MEIGSRKVGQNRFFKKLVQNYIALHSEIDSIIKFAWNLLAKKHCLQTEKPLVSHVASTVPKFFVDFPVSQIYIFPYHLMLRANWTT